MARYIMSLDAGTTSNRCILFDEKGEMCSVAQKEFTQYFPKPGWVEHDPEEIWATQLEVAQKAMANLGAEAKDIAAIGITNQRETAIVWDKHTGVPVYPAIVWQCRRTSEYCDLLKEKGMLTSILSLGLYCAGEFTIGTWGATYAVNVLAVSPDGFNFKLKYDQPFDIETQIDTQNILFWDSRLKKYHLYTRIRRFGKRGIRMHLTEDFKTFTNASDLSFRNDMFPDTQLYTNGIQPYFRAEKYYLGFPCRYCDHDQKWDESVLYMPGAERKAYWINDRKYSRLGTAVTDTLFMSSRNGWIFERYDESFLRPGPCTDGNWLYGDNYLFYGMIPTCSDLGCGAPDEISMYAIENYMGDNGENVRFRRLSIRQDGFVSLNFPAQGGEVITKAFEFEGESFSLNLATSAWGTLSVAILDEDGNPIDGFREKDMFPIYGDGLDIRPMWRGKGSDLRELKGRKIALRFRGKDADLYSYAQTAFRPDPQLPPITPDAIREADI